MCCVPIGAVIVGITREAYSGVLPELNYRIWDVAARLIGLAWDLRRSIFAWR